MSVSPAPVEASPPSRPPSRAVGGAPSSRTWSGVGAVAERRRGRCSPGRSDRTHEGKAECEWRASLLLRGLRAPGHRPLLKKIGKIVKASSNIFFHSTKNLKYLHNRNTTFSIFFFLQYQNCFSSYNMISPPYS